VKREWIAARNQQLADEPYCLICGSTYGIVVHHIETHGLGVKNNAASNLATLCFNHHTGCEGVHPLGRDTFNRMFGNPFDTEGDSDEG